MKDLHSRIKLVPQILPIVGNNDTAGTPAQSVDRMGYNSVEHVVLLGATGDTLSGSTKIEFKLQHSDNNTDWEAVTSADYVLVESDSGVSVPDENGIFRVVDANAEDDTTYRIGYVGPKRYSRVFADFVGTHSNGIPLAVLGILGDPAVAPTQDK